MAALYAAFAARQDPDRGEPHKSLGYGIRETGARSGPWAGLVRFSLALDPRNEFCIRGLPRVNITSF